MKKDIMRLLECGGTVRINNISVLSRWTKDACGNPVDRLELRFDNINGVCFSVGNAYEISSREYEGIIEECADATERFLSAVAERLVKNMENGYVTPSPSMMINRYVFIFDSGCDWTIICYENEECKKSFCSAEDDWDDSLDYADMFVENGGNRYYYKLPEFEYVLDGVDIFNLKNEPISKLDKYLKKERK